jgi:DHA1 family multidrug resistance protein-like MFS transporter
VFGVLGMAVCGLAAIPEHVFAGRVLQSFGGGPQSAAMALTGVLVPVSRMGLALGLLQTGQSVGSALGPVIGGIVGDTIGYRYSFLVAAGIVAIISGVAAVFVKEPPRPPRSAVGSGGFFSGFVDTLRVPVLRDLMLLILVFQSGYQTVWTFLPLRIQEIAPDPSLVGTYSGAAFMGDALGIAVGASAMGWLAPRLGLRRVLLVACIGGAAVTGVQAFTTSIPLFVLLRFGSGLASGGMLTVSRSLLAQYARAERRGTVFGVSQGAFSLAFAVGAAVGSYLIAVWGLAGTFAAAVVFLVVSIPSALRSTAAKA